MAISHETKITIGLASSLLGGVLWLSNLHAKTVANSETIQRIQEKQKDQDSKIEAVLVNTTNANAKLDILLDERKNR